MPVVEDTHLSFLCFAFKHGSAALKTDTSHIVPLDVPSLFWLPFLSLLFLRLRTCRAIFPEIINQQFPLNN